MLWGAATALGPVRAGGPIRMRSRRVLPPARGVLLGGGYKEMIFDILNLIGERTLTL